MRFKYAWIHVFRRFELNGKYFAYLNDAWLEFDKNNQDFIKKNSEMSNKQILYSIWINKIKLILN